MKNNKGFSLVELIVVIAIMAILAAIAIPTFAHFIEKANVSNDNELLGNINYIFSAACLENGVDVKDVTGAKITISDSGIVLTTVKVNNKENTDIVTSFTQHFADMKISKFKSKEYKDVTVLNFSPATQKFDKGAAVNNVLNYGNGINISQSDLDALNNSTFGSMSMDTLLNQLNDVTVFASGITGSNAMQSVLTSADFRANAAQALGVPEDQLDAEVARLAAEKVAKNPGLSEEDAKNQVLANAAVLYSAQQTAGMNKNDLTSFLAAPSKDIIVSNMNNDPGKGLAQASLICGMYTAYIQTDEFQQRNQGNETPTVDAVTVLDALETDIYFQQYLKDAQTEGTQGQKDLDGYLASLNMIEGSTDDPDAVSDLMINGFNDPDLIKGFDDLIN